MKSYLFTVFLFIALATRSAAQAPGTPVRSPFDKDDPEIQAILRLNWKGVDFNSLDPRSRCLSYLALSKGLSAIGAKADARLDLLMDFIDEQALGEALAKSKETIPEPPVPTFEDMKKVGAAWVQSPEGKQKVATELTSISDDGLRPYLTMYEKSARRSFEEALESRHQVRVMALFLEKQGKLEEFRRWSAEERKRRLTERAAAAAKQQAEAAEAERQRREDAMEAAEQKRRQDAELSAMRMEIAAQQQQVGAAQESVPYFENPQYWDDDDVYWAYPYYYSNAYRGEVRDRVENAWERWQGRPQPTPQRSARSGGRAGGRR